MADEDIDIIITNKQYQQYKLYKSTITKLQTELTQQKDIQNSKDIKINKLQKDNKFKQTQILFLSNLVRQAISYDKKDKGLEFSVINGEGNSVSFQVLGESVMFNKGDEKQLEFKDKEFIKKYQDLLIGVTSLSQKFQAQEELIAKLNKMNADNNQLLINKNQQELINILKGKVPVEVKSLEEIIQIINQSKQNKQKIDTLGADNKSLQEKIEKIKDQMKKLTQALGMSTEKIKKSEHQNTLLKQELKTLQDKLKSSESNISFGDKPYQIKLLIDNHIKDMTESLGQLGGLTKEEINTMLNAELKSLIEYIPKSMDKR